MGPVLLIFVWALIVLSNFVPNTWFLGWDSLASSLNPVLSIRRSFFGSWQGFQGLGILGGHAYQSQLPHAIFQLLLSILIPKQYLRYIFSFLMLLSGPIGIFFISKKVFYKNNISELASSLIATLVALTYLLHFASVQTFYFQLEPFIAMYGLLPWSLFLLFQILKKPSKKKYFYFFILNFFFSITAFVPPVFISYILFVSVILIAELLLERNKRTLKIAFAIIAIIFLSNAYWIPPLGLFTINQKNDYLNSTLNQDTTPSYQLKSKYYGRIEKLAVPESLYFDSYDQNRFDKQSNLAEVLQPWINHFENKTIKTIAYFLFSIAILGIFSQILLLIKKRESKYAIGICGLLVILFLTQGETLLSPFSKIIESVPILGQAFRIPFSKLSMSLSFFLSLGIGGLLYSIYSLIRKKSKLASTLAITLSFLAIIPMLSYYSLPSFQGNYLYKGSKIKLPKSYEKLFHYLKKEDASLRIAPLPIITSSGWDIHKWEGKPGYTGSGFLWYDIKQAMLHRSFDVWSPYNESFFREAFHAQKQSDPEKLLNVLKKYSVSFVLVDESIYDPNNIESKENIENLRSSLKQLSAKLAFKDDFISLYKINDKKELLSAPNTYKKTNGFETSRLNYDPIFDPNLAYISKKAETKNSSTFPFLEILKDSNNLLEISNNKDYAFISLNKNMDVKDENTFLEIPISKTGLQSYPSEISYENGELGIKITNPVKITVNEEEIDVPDFEKISMETATSNKEILVNINKQAVELNPGDSFEEFISLEYGKEILIEVIDKKSINNENNNELSSIDKDQIITKTVDANFWNTHQNNILSKLNEENNEIQIQVKSPIYKIDSKKISETKEKHCDPRERGSINKEYKNGKIIYRSENQGTLCDSAKFDSVSSSDAFIMKVKGENNSGLSPSIQLRGEDNALWSRIASTDSFYENNFLVIPENSFSLSNPSLTIDNRSHGLDISQNSIEAFNLYSYPIKLVSTISVNSNDSEIKNNSEIKKINYNLGFLYSVKMSSGSGDGLLAFSQAYNDFWLAFARPANTPAFSLPLFNKRGFSFNYSLLPHYKHNGWANAWMIENPGEYEVIIIFWPQLLSFLGYVLLIGTFLGFIIIFARDRKLKNKDQKIKNKLKSSLLGQ